MIQKKKNEENIEKKKQWKTKIKENPKIVRENYMQF